MVNKINEVDVIASHPSEKARKRRSDFERRLDEICKRPELRPVAYMHWEEIPCYAIRPRRDISSD